MTANDGPTKRILHVLDLLFRNGPMTLSEMVQQCAFSRAAVWRALDTLRETGWVRMRLGDHAFVLRPDKAMRLSDASKGFQVSEQVTSIMQELERTGAVHVCLGRIDAKGLTIIESTDRKDYEINNISLVQDGLAIAAQTLLPNLELVHLLREYMEKCSLHERQLIQDGRHAQRLRSAKTRGYVEWNDGSELAFPLPLKGHALAFKLRSKTESVLEASAYIAAQQRICGCLS